MLDEGDKIGEGRSATLQEGAKQTLVAALNAKSDPPLTPHEIANAAFILLQADENVGHSNGSLTLLENKSQVHRLISVNPPVTISLRQLVTWIMACPDYEVIEKYSTSHERSCYIRMR